MVAAGHGLSLAGMLLAVAGLTGLDTPEPAAYP